MTSRLTGTTARAPNREALSHAELASMGAIGWRWPAADDLRRPLWPVALAAVDLLRDGDRLARLKQCRHCRWLFLDASRNRGRRWCSMGHCGTDAKVRQLRERRARAGNRPSRARSE